MGAALFGLAIVGSEVKVNVVTLAEGSSEVGVNLVTLAKGSSVGTEEGELMVGNLGVGDALVGLVVVG